MGHFKKIIYSDQKCRTLNRYFREKILFFLLLLFPLLCSTKKTQGNAVCAKKSASGSTTAFLAFGFPLLCFTNHSIMLFGKKVGTWVHLHQSFLQALCIVAIDVGGGRTHSHYSSLKYSPPQLRMMFPSFVLQKMSEHLLN